MVSGLWVGLLCHAEIHPRALLRLTSTPLTELHSQPSCSRGKQIEIFNIKLSHGYGRLVCGDQEKLKLELREEGDQKTNVAAWDLALVEELGKFFFVPFLKLFGGFEII